MDREQARANARLIAAAPSMLALLQQIAAFDEYNGQREDEGEDAILTLNNVIDMARAALAKAEGRG